MKFGKMEAEYFSRGDWTGQIRLMGLTNLVFARTWSLRRMTAAAVRRHRERSDAIQGPHQQSGLLPPTPDRLRRTRRRKGALQ